MSPVVSVISIVIISKFFISKAIISIVVVKFDSDNVKAANGVE